MKKGFTLVEIMIVVAIIALLAAIAIPNLLRARLNANESAAIAALQTISTAEQSYRASNPRYGTLAELGNSSPPYIDSVLASGNKQGYSFSLSAFSDTFTCVARPQTYGKTGVRSFYVDESGVIRYSTVNNASIATIDNDTWPPIE